jgi:predicted Zn finger-like uncharacterized protein
MPILVACPTCNGQLRVADDLIGRKVRCPACNCTFDASEAAPVRPQREEPPVETVPVAPWSNLNLELTDDPKREEDSPPVEKTNGAAAKGAVEIDVPPGDDPARPRATRRAEEIAPEEDSPRDRDRGRRPRLNDDHDDLKPCPSCRKMIHRESTRCYSCGERLASRRSRDEDEDEDAPRRPRRARRDAEPHRGGLILTFGIISAATLFVCWPLAPFALGFGVAAWWMGQGDLRKIREGTMDPDGEGTTQAGRICGVIGVFLNLIAVLACGGIMSFIWYTETQQAKQQNRPQFQGPPPKVIGPKRF